MTIREVKEKKGGAFESSPLGKMIMNPEKAENIYRNKLEGCQREEAVMNELSKKYPAEKGFSIIREAYLRDKDGFIVRDTETGCARRIDFVVVKGNKAIKSIEVTSENADKKHQLAKEKRIRDSGGRFIRDSYGNLIENSVETTIERRK